MEQTNAMATFQMKGYRILKLLLDNPLIDFSEEDVGISYFAQYKYEKIEDCWSGAVLLGFRLVNVQEGEDPAEDEPPFMEAIIEGNFSDSVVSNEGDFEKRLKINGASTLIPIIRAAICSASALMGFPGKFSIPNINVFSLEWICVNSKEAE